jgi:hypothetical protein
MQLTRHELKTLYPEERKAHPTTSYIKNFTESQLRQAREFLDQGFSQQQIDQIFGLPTGGTRVAWALQRWSQGGIPSPTAEAYDIDVQRVGAPRGGTRRTRKW